MTPDYEPLDLASVCTVAGEAVGIAAPTGQLTLRGLPFRVVDPTDPRAPQFLLLEPGGGQVLVPVGGRPRRVVVAHRLLPDGADVTTATGAVVGRYTFRYVDGGVAAVDIRRRFEIDVPQPEGWDFDVPFLAAMSSRATPPDVDKGRWEQLGDRLSEAHLEFPPAYLLWTWSNPRPHCDLLEIAFEAVDGRVVVAGVTLGHVDEDPIPRQAARPVTVEPTDGRVVGPGPLTLQVDRGTASYTRPLAPGTAEDFLDGRVRGFGQARSPEAG